MLNTLARTPTLLKGCDGALQMNVQRIYLGLAVLLVLSCSNGTGNELTLDQAAEQFVKLGLELGEHDSLYIGMYLGPDEWREHAKANLRSKEQLSDAIRTLLAKIEAMDPAAGDDSVRHKSLLGNVRAMDMRIRMARGEKFTFTEEAKLLLDVDVPRYELADFDRMLKQIEISLPGEGELIDRIEALRTSVTIPEDKLDVVFSRTLEECARRTAEYIILPQDERVRVEYVSGGTGGGYSEYLGENESLITIYTDTSITPDYVVVLACHEGYPGHHVASLLIEQRYLVEKAWIEFQMQSLWGPAVLIGEGSAEYGIKLAFPENESVEFQLEVLAPLAGLDPEKVALWNELIRLRSQLSEFTATATAQRYLDGEITREEAIDLSQKYGLLPYDRAERSIRFAEGARTYVLTYSLGEDIVETYIEKQSGGDPAARWKAFEQLIVELPATSDLVK
jgi:hypothetical protein